MSQTSTVEDYRRTDRLMRSRLDLYCQNLVKITGRDGRMIPFIWNDVQHELHRRIEQQKADRGIVRCIVLKARKLGISTYVAARYYNRTTLFPGNSTYILTHEDAATKTLFGMAKDIHENMVSDYRPIATTDNADELEFGGIRSGYGVGTAKNVSGLGRSQTLQLFHGSEVGFWPQAEVHFSGVLQAIPLARGTEIILESTANGIGDVFYEQWSLAESGKSDFIAVFLPWFREGTFRHSPYPDWEPTQEEVEYGELYGLDREQLYWMHAKNIELGGQPGKLGTYFKQEYPATAAEAFQSAGTKESLIPTEAVVRARRLILPRQPHAPRVIGVDIARGGDDSTRIIDRQGRKAGVINEKYDDGDLVVVADKIAHILHQNPDIKRAYIDATEMGGGSVYDMLCAMGYSKQAVAVNFGANATDTEKFVNKRAEMYGRMNMWFRDQVGADIPDEDGLHAELVAPGFHHDANSRLQIEAKDKVKARLKRSPDGADALALTFAEVIAPDASDDLPDWAKEHMGQAQGRDFMTS